MGTSTISMATFNSKLLIITINKEIRRVSGLSDSPLFALSRQSRMKKCSVRNTKKRRLWNCIHGYGTHMWKIWSTYVSPTTSIVDWHLGEEKAVLTCPPYIWKVVHDSSYFIIFRCVPMFPPHLWCASYPFHLSHGPHLHGPQVTWRLDRWMHLDKPGTTTREVKSGEMSESLEKKIGTLLVITRG